MALVASPSDAADALEQAWEPFVLVAGLLLIGDAAQRDGVFAAAGARLERLPAGGAALLIACLALVALTTALLNLDTAAVFLTPVLLHAAWRRGLAEGAFLYGSVMMVNAASLFLPGSNLTNLLVLEREEVAGSVFAARMAVALGTLARGWSGPAQLVDDAGRFETAAIAAIAAVLVNNLPAAVLLSAGPIPHPRALLVGLAIGPNLFVTGSLSAYLWWQAARGAGAHPTIRGFVRHGLILAPAAIVAALTVAALTSAPS